MTGPSTDVDATEDVNDFLQRIRELGERRDKEDEERTRRLEEEIIQGRKERQARRAERARSIPPTKDTPLSNIAPLSPSSSSQRVVNSLENLEPVAIVSDLEISSDLDQNPVSNISRRNAEQEETKPPRLDMDIPSRENRVPLRSRAGTLLWQQRPLSRDLNGNSSFISTSPTRASHLRTASTISDNYNFSRDHIVLAPPSKDASPCGQSIRRDSNPLDPQKNSNMSLSGGPDLTDDDRTISLVREPISELEKQTGAAVEKAEEQRSWSPSRPDSTVGNSSTSHRYSSVSSVSTGSGLGSPAPLSTAQKLEPTATGATSDDKLTAGGSPKRMLPDRSTSPTKGLGGFVQSAMMKRSDSISKRWSTQMSPGLPGINRTSSIMANRNSFTGSTRSDPLHTPTGSKFNQEGPSSPSYRLSLRHNQTTVLCETSENERPITPPNALSISMQLNESASIKPPSFHMKSPSARTWEDQNADFNTDTSTSSRAVDSNKRWSPVKTSWLESALNRPEASRHTKHSSLSSPWPRERQSRGSIDLGPRSGSKGATPTINLMKNTVTKGHHKNPSASEVLDRPGNLGIDENTEAISERVQRSVPEVVEGTDTKPVSITPGDISIENTLPQEDITHSHSRPTTLQQEASSNITKSHGDKDFSPEQASKSPNPVSPIARAPMAPRPSSKPQPPVVDFRSNLRRRETPKESSPKEEPEFKNVFGKLKKAQTSSYVAPDELKENILRGKASLNATSSPKRTQKVDEIKENLIRQREAIKAGGGSSRRTAEGISTTEKHTASIPEAIAKRNNMKDTTGKRDNRPLDVPPSLQSQSPETLQLPSGHQQPASPSPDESNPEVTQGSQLPLASEPRYLRSEGQGKDSASDDSELDDGKAVGLEEGSDVVDDGSKSVDGGDETIRQMQASLSDNIMKTASVRTGSEDGLAANKPVSRINPALAKVLSRGQPVAASDSFNGTPLTSTMENSITAFSTGAPTEPLTHLTKNRTRGPKRRPPGSGPIGPANTGSSEPEPPCRVIGSSNSMQTIPSIEKSLDVIANAPTPDNTQEDLQANVERIPVQDASYSIVIGAENTEQIAQPIACIQERFQNSLQPTDMDRNGEVDPEIVGSAAENQNGPPVPPKLMNSPSSLLSEASQRTGSYSSWPSSRLKTSPGSDTVCPQVDDRCPITSKLGADKQLDAPLRGKSLPPLPIYSRRTLDKHAIQSPLAPAPSMSLISDAATSKEVMSNFFRTFPNSSNRVDIDPQMALTDAGDDQKIRTLKKQIWEITGEAKRQDLPINQEYILYEGSMYLCVHMFEIGGGTRTEVQLWCGDDVTETAIDEAQSFARKVARDNGCKLELLKQGKETSRFIQARGGIMITRRGSNSRSSSSALYMLCGRRHLGQVVFDEVDLSRWNLCSGYPFVISAPFGKLYLWRGKGSGPEEIGAARLIGMDLGLTGEIEEVAEGSEPEGFFENFPDYRGKGEYLRSEYWQLKPAHAHFRTRLLRVDHELGQRSGFWMRRPGSSSPVIRPNDTVQEISPFSYKDLTSKDIFILDIFFEIYVIVGAQASHRSAEFASALVFAHEYGIMAASLQDRPFIPKTLISIGGLPVSCRSAFRKWDKRSWLLPVRTLTLNAAIEAIRP